MKRNRGGLSGYAESGDGRYAINLIESFFALAFTIQRTGGGGSHDVAPVVAATLLTLVMGAFQTLYFARLHPQSFGNIANAVLVVIMDILVVMLFAKLGVAVVPLALTVIGAVVAFVLLRAVYPWKNAVDNIGADGKSD